jgi:hypothetical protein
MINIITLNKQIFFYCPLKKITLVNLGVMCFQRPLCTSVVIKPHPNSTWKNEWTFLSTHRTLCIVICIVDVYNAFTWHTYPKKLPSYWQRVCMSKMGNLLLSHHIFANLLATRHQVVDSSIPLCKNFKRGNTITSRRWLVS